VFGSLAPSPTPLSIQPSTKPQSSKYKPDPFHLRFARYVCWGELNWAIGGRQWGTRAVARACPNRPRGRERIFMRKFLLLVFVLGLSGASVAAQSESALKAYFEGKQVTLRIAIPQTSRGVDIYPERALSLDVKEYTERLNESGALLNRGERRSIRTIEFHSNRIEVTLADTNTGFNIHFSRLESWMLTPATVVDALNRYVEFSGNDKNGARLLGGSTDAAGYVRKGVVHVGPRSTYLKEGLTTGEVVSLLGAPASISESKREGQSLLVYEFQRSGDRVLIAEFLGGSLITTRTETKSLALMKTNVTSGEN
jgi:hypothetical protein